MQVRVYQKLRYILEFVQINSWYNNLILRQFREFEFGYYFVDRYPFLFIHFNMHVII